jgi:hypothetical protein
MGIIDSVRFEVFGFAIRFCARIIRGGSDLSHVGSENRCIIFVSTVTQFDEAASGSSNEVGR